MIVKPFAPSSLTLGLQALVRRLHPSHPQFTTLQQELKNKEAGDFAEHYILKELEKLPQLSDCHIFHNVMLPTVLPMQIDILVITSSGVIILEIKNIRGTVHFKNDPRQLIRTLDTGEIQVFTHPEIQLEQYIQAMHHVLNKHDIMIPIYGAIVFPFNNVEIHREGEGLPIVMGRELPMYLHKLLAKNKGIATTEITNIILSQLQHRKPYPLCRYYQIDPNALQRGVFCENCGHFGMEKLKRTWLCQRCQHRCTDAHVQALKDYYMLVGDTITNRDCREFLKIDSEYIAKRLLQKSLPTRCNTGKYTKYYLSSLLESPIRVSKSPVNQYKSPIEVDESPITRKKPPIEARESPINQSNHFQKATINPTKCKKHTENTAK
ncbi:nuclease-related domain-containing protein [Lysinibacillus sp. NPDC093197]|uniref:nuclease-related domain-containing protein n=1 Tax=Lysinibacillus sp. NPDC093197 TaxID=3364132 RepID=UPI00380049D8